MERCQFLPKKSNCTKASAGADVDVLRSTAVAGIFFTGGSSAGVLR